MAKRRAESKPLPERLPEHLASRCWRDFVPTSPVIPEWVDPEKVAGYLFHLGRRNLRTVRGEFMAALRTKPLGVGDIEWMAALNLQYIDMGTEKARALGL